MHVCTCGNRTATAALLPEGSLLGQIFCENFRRCPEEDRTGVRNEDWMRFLAADREAPEKKAPERSEVLTSGLIYLKAVRERATSNASIEAPQAARPPSIPIPAVLVPRHEERPVSSRAWLLGAVAVLGAATLVGVQAYRDSGGGPSGARSTTPETRGPARAAAPVPEAPEPARGALAGALTEPFRAPAAVPVSPAAEPGPGAVASTEADPPRTRSAHKRATTERRHHRRSERRGERARDPDADVDVNPIPQDPNYTLHGALARMGGDRAPTPAGSQGKAPASSPGASAAPAPAPRLEGPSDPRLASGVDALLKRAAAPTTPSAGAPERLAPMLAERLSATQVSSLSRQIVGAVRACATRFGFAKLTLKARARVTGATGAVSGLSLGGRFAGSPVEQCARRSSAGLRAAPFAADGQALSVPIVLH